MISFSTGELIFELMKTFHRDPMTVAEMEAKLKSGPGLQGDMEQQAAAQCVKPPPLGLCPREIHRSQRIGSILGAIWRYTDANKVIPFQWVDELQQLVDEHNEELQK